MSTRYVSLFLCNYIHKSYCLFSSSTADEAYREGDIRLVGGSYNWEGRVEIYWSGQWGAISDSSWTDDDASVVCRQLRHSDSGTCNPYAIYDGFEYLSALGCMH